MPKTTCTFTCPECKKKTISTTDAPSIDWNVERLSDSLTEDESEITCQQCGTTFATSVQNSPSLCTVTLIDHPDVEISATDAVFDDEDCYDDAPED